MKLVFESQFTNLLVLLNGIVFLIFFYYRKKKRERAMKFGNFETLRKVSDSHFLKTDDLMLVTKLLGITALIIGISSPVLIQQERVSKADYAILLDSSGSMFTSDIEPNRFQAAKDSATGFVEGLPNETKVGFLTYAGAVDERVGMTSNHRAVVEGIQGSELGDSAGTAIGNAISSGVDMLLEVNDTRKMILLTDGTNNQGIDLDTAVGRAVENNITINAIGIGKEGNESQEYGMLRGRNVTKAESPNLNPENLRMIAERTSGNVSIVSNSTELDRAFTEIEKDKVRTDLSGFLIIFAAFLLVLEWVLKATDLEVLP